MKNFCSNCGAKLKEGANFCASCGEPAGVTPVAHYEIHAPCPEPPKHMGLSCMLAYVPGLFWLPLASSPRDNAHREAANQGLILTLLFLLFGAITMCILGGLLQHGYDLGQIERLFVGLTAQNWMERFPQILGWMGLTALALYAPINGICGIFHSMASDKPYQITIFGRLHLIRQKADVEIDAIGFNR